MTAPLPMTAAEIAEALALAEAATPEPWQDMPDARQRVNLIHVETGEGCPVGQGVPIFSVTRNHAADAAFAVAARTLVPRLCATAAARDAEIAALRAKLAAAEAVVAAAEKWRRHEKDFDARNGRCGGCVLRDDIDAVLAAWKEVSRG